MLTSQDIQKLLVRVYYDTQKTQDRAQEAIENEVDEGVAFELKNMKQSLVAKIFMDTMNKETGLYFQQSERVSKLLFYIIHEL